MKFLLKKVDLWFLGHVVSDKKLYRKKLQLASQSKKSLKSFPKCCACIAIAV